MSFARHRLTSYLALAAAIALVPSACGSTTPASKVKPVSSSSTTTVPSAADVYQLMRKSTAAAKSVRIKGTITNSATTTNKTTSAQIDIAGDRAGKSTRMTVRAGTGAVEILTVGGKSYLKADKAYWTKNGTPSMAKKAAGKYILIPAAYAAGLSDLAVGTLLDQIFTKSLSTASKLNTSVKQTKVNGVTAYFVTTKADDTKVYVSADGRARLLRWEGPRSKPGSLDFTEWDAVAPMSAPPADHLAKIPGL